MDWELEELVGVGGFGEVWKARHAYLRSKPPVALKFCLDPSAAPSLRNEAGVLDHVMQQGRHAGIVPLLHTYLSADPPCLEYEFVEGGDLAGLIQDLHARGAMTPAMANRLLLRLAEIIAFAHRGNPPIVHGDLKPANILVRRDAEDEMSLWVTDFGIGGLAAELAARESRQPTRSRQELVTEAVRGAYTPLYASPEQMRRRKGEPADPRDDVHALGVIWYQLLTGDLGMMSIPPDWREQVEERGLGTDLLRLLASCIASRAEKRLGNAVVLVEQLKAALGDTRDTRTGETSTTWSENRKGATRLPQPGEVITNSLGMKFAWCPPGRFLMGSPPDEEGRKDDETQHRVSLTKGYYLGVTLVTQAQWQAVMGVNPSKFKGDDRPVEKVSWDECQEFCKRLGALEGNRYRLPTEAEWEYACRAGTTTPFSFGATISTAWANYDGNHTYSTGEQGIDRQQTTPVGSFPGNAWGLCDMHGNVWEWCEDRFTYWTLDDIQDPFCVTGSPYRMLRGGSYCDKPENCRSTIRGKYEPARRYNYLGCRVVLCLD